MKYLFQLLWNENLEFRELLEMEKMQSISTLKLVDWLEFKANYISIFSYIVACKIGWKYRTIYNTAIRTEDKQPLNAIPERIH
jgi:hypothetical protein